MNTALTGKKIPINCIVLDIIIAMYRNYNNSMYTLKCLVNLTCNGETLTMLFHYLLGDRSTAVHIPVEDCKLGWDQHIELDSLQLWWLWFVVLDTQLTLELLKSDP